MDIRQSVKSKWAIEPRAKDLLSEAFFINVHDQMMMELPIRKALGEENPLDDYYGPLIRKGGLNALTVTVGGNCPCTVNLSDHITVGSLNLIDMLHQEVEKSNSFEICESVADIENAHKSEKISLILTSEGARMMEGLVDEDDLSLVRTFHRLGLRQCCIVSPARTMAADGPGDAIAGGGLTTFGRKLIKEMNRIGMVVDTAHMTDIGFYDIMNVANKPLIDSHTCCKAIVDSGRNVSDDRIKAIASTGGVISLAALKAFVKGPEYHESGAFVGVDDLMVHIHHIANLVGVDHIALGTDNDEFPLVRNLHRAWSPYPGSLEGLEIGVPTGNMIIDDLHAYDRYYLFVDALVRTGFSDSDIRKIMGGNMLRVYKQVFGK